MSHLISQCCTPKLTVQKFNASQLRAIEMWRTVFFILTILCSVGARNVTVCEAGDPLFIGTFSPIEDSVGGAHVYTNPNGKSFFQNNGFWYLGDLRNWPPETNYRCVGIEGCNHGLDIPPTTNEGVWSASKLGKPPVPHITAEQCIEDSIGSSSLVDNEL